MLASCLIAAFLKGILSFTIAVLFDMAMIPHKLVEFLLQQAG